ncbi:SGNH/GDSL hydrolase family protein [Arthrobacter mangrovi]|uniref:SGNH/GDSL hydrolase family protein n=1 Tax=Arthrobacter mangrovi TaxID=2966350 RepID=UPI002230E1DA|nr:SGNH/GDSL hydrolase family protein [Arthrobacter mangrovi]
MVPEVDNRTGKSFRTAVLAALSAVALAGAAASPAAAEPKTLDLVALGDSYSAGVGAGPLQESPLAPGSGCLVAAPGYVEALGQLPAVGTAVAAACSGATSSQVAQQVSGARELGILGRQTELITVTAGANDIHYEGVIAACAVGTVAFCRTVVNAAVAAARSEVAPRLAAGYRLIHRSAPRADIAAIGYPHLFADGGAGPVMSADAAAVLNDGVDRLNRIIERAARTSPRTVFVDVVDDFEGHGIGSADPWINLGSYPAADGTDFHPTAEGYAEGYAAAVAAEVKSLSR